MFGSVIVRCFLALSVVWSTQRIEADDFVSQVDQADEENQMHSYEDWQRVFLMRQIDLDSPRQIPIDSS